jgi:hypothetical protein
LKLVSLAYISGNPGKALTARVVRPISNIRSNQSTSYIGIESCTIQKRSMVTRYVPVQASLSLDAADSQDIAYTKRRAVHLTKVISPDHESCESPSHFIGIGLDAFIFFVENWKQYLDNHPPRLVAWCFVRRKKNQTVTRGEVR